MADLTKRKLMRLKDYDYSQAGRYFITLCVKGGHEVLSEIINGQSVLNEYGSIVKQEIERIPAIRKECFVEKSVIMPNHIHLIVRIAGDGCIRPVLAHNQTELRADCHPPLRKSVSHMVQGFKGAVTRRIGFSLWQRSFHDHIIRNNAEYQKIWRYIDENPVKWQEDRYYIL